MYNVNNIDEMINKSLESVNELSEKSKDLTKSVEGMENKDEVNPEEVAEGVGQEPEVGATPEEDNEGGEPETDTDEEQPVAKSLVDNLSENENVKKALEVSEFLNELSKGISSVLDTHSNSLNKSLQASNSTSMLLAKSLGGIVDSQKAVMETQSAILKSLQAMTSRLETVESTPVVRKSVSVNPLVVSDKDFKKSLGTTEQPKELSKSEVLSKLEGAYSTGNMALANDIIKYESTGNLESLSPNAKQILGM